MFDSSAPGSPPLVERLFSMNVSTGDTHLFGQVAAGGAADGTLAFSPDGRTIAFGYPATGGERVVFMSVASGRTTRSISIPGAQGSVFQWLPDGRLLLLSVSGTLQTVSATGAGLRPIDIKVPPNTQMEAVAASPSGSELAMTLGRWTSDVCGFTCSFDVYVAPTAGGTAIRLTHSGAAVGPVWSPDGKLLAYADGTATKLMTVATRQTTTIRRPSGGARVVGWLPAR